MCDPKECFKLHSILHSISGLGVGLILVSLIPDLIGKAFTLGLVIIIGVAITEFVLKEKPAKKKK